MRRHILRAGNRARVLNELNGIVSTAKEQFAGLIKGQKRKTVDSITDIGSNELNGIFESEDISSIT